MPTTERICALLARVAGRLMRWGIECSVHHGNGWFVFLARRGAVPPDVLRALIPGMRPGLAPPTDDELQIMGHLSGGPLTGPELAERLGMAAEGGGFQKRVAALLERGLVYNPGKGYRLTEYGAWAYQRDS